MLQYPQRHDDAVSLADQMLINANHLLRLVKYGDDRSLLTPSELSVLTVLMSCGATSLGDLASNEGVRPPSMTRTVDGLERKELARRWRAKADRRKFLVVATTKGREVLECAREIRLKRLVKLFGRLGESQLRNLRNSGEILSDLLASPDLS